MTSIGLARRGGRCGLYLRTHDLGGTEWSLLLPLDRASALHLHDHGVIVAGEEAAAMHGATCGIVILPDRIEARHALARPATTFAGSPLDGALRIEGEADGHPPISRLFSSTRPGRRIRRRSIRSGPRPAPRP